MDLDWMVRRLSDLTARGQRTASRSSAMMMLETPSPADVSRWGRSDRNMDSFAGQGSTLGIKRCTFALAAVMEEQPKAGAPHTWRLIAQATPAFGPPGASPEASNHLSVARPRRAADAGRATRRGPGLVRLRRSRTRLHLHDVDASGPSIPGASARGNPDASSVPPRRCRACPVVAGELCQDLTSAAFRLPSRRLRREKGPLGDGLPGVRSRNSPLNHALGELGPVPPTGIEPVHAV